jgi:branched-chain amino acid transport system substrate-binding protein
LNKKHIGLFSIFCVFATMVMLVLVLGGCSSASTTAPSSISAPASSAAPISTAAPAAKTLTIGADTFLTGPASQGGLAYKQGWQLVVDKYNKDGGLKIGNDTYKLKLDVEDDAMSTDQAVTVVTKFLSQDNDKFIIGGMTPAIKNVIYPLTAKAGALYALADGTNQSAVLKFDANSDVGSNKPLLIRTWRSYDETVPGLLDFLQAKYPNVKTVALFAVSDAGDAPMAAYIKTELTKRGMSVVGDLEIVAPNISDWYPPVTRMLANKPDALFNITGTPNSAGGCLKVARESGFTGPVFYTTKADPALQAKISGPNTTDLFGAAFTVDSNLPQTAKDIITQYNSTYPPEQFITDVLCAYEGLWTLLQTMEKAQSVDPQTVLTTYEKLSNSGDLQGLLGPARVGGLKTYGTNRVICEPMTISGVWNGTASNAKVVNIDIP